MPTLDLPPHGAMLRIDGNPHIDFETIESLISALHQIRARKPIIIRSKKDGVRQVLWAPEDDRR